MDTLAFQRISSRTFIDISSSGTVIPSLTNSQWNMTAFAVGWAGVSISSTFQLLEVATTVSTVIFQWNVTASMGLAKCFFGEIGLQASTLQSSLKMITGTASNGSIAALFTGYYTGG